MIKVLPINEKKWDLSRNKMGQNLILRQFVKWSRLVYSFEMMQKGLNDDIQVMGTSYHVQTEDWGAVKAAIVTRIFKNGAVIKSVKTPYTQLLATGLAVNENYIRRCVKEQHQKILDQLTSGQLK